ncbi:MAG: YIP1 family protein [Thermomicrobiales bacterium]
MSQTSSFSDRVVGVLRLVAPTYREIARDTTATTQAAGVVAIVAVAAAIGGAGEGIKGVIGGAIGAIIWWVIFSVATWFVGTKMMGASDIGGGPGRMLRTSGFAQAPNALAILGFIPVLGWIAAIVGAIWALITGVMAVREALGVSTGKAIVTAIVAWILVAIVTGILFAILGISIGVAAG